MLGHCKIMGICLQMVCKMSYVPLNAENCLQNVRIISPTFIVAFFFHLDGKKCLHKLNSSVFNPARMKVRRALVITLAPAWPFLRHTLKLTSIFFFNFHISTTTGLKYFILKVKSQHSISFYSVTSCPRDRPWDGA